MILPPRPCSIICLPASCMPMSTPSVLTRTIELKFASSTSKNGTGLLKPALLNSTSMPPNAATVWPIIALTCARSATSTFDAIAFRPLPRSSAASASALSPFKSATTTRAPASARRRTMPSPRPCAPPVTTILFASIPRMACSFLVMRTARLGVNRDGNQRDESDEPVLIRLRQTEKRRDGVDLLNEDRSEQHADEGAASAEQAGAAENDRRDAGERVAYALVGIADTELGHDHDAADDGQQRAGDKRADDSQVGSHADTRRGLLV